MYLAAAHNKIDFLALQEPHIPLLFKWLKEPHVAEFWQETEDIGEFREKFLNKLPERGVSAFVILVDSKPIGYIQYYEACKVGGGWWPDAIAGTFGIDQFIGDRSMIGKGLGTRVIRQFVEKLFTESNVIEIITDPEPNNKRAIRAYENVGFKSLGEIKTPGGNALLMRLKRADLG
jgi:RimJ/RimL family protein N-acetyltransferase